MSITKTNYKKYLFEILVIFIGISLSFLVEDYREYLGQKQSQKNTLLELYDNLNNDILLLNDYEVKTSEVIDNLKILEEKGKDLELDSLFYRISFVHQIATWQANTSAYNKMMDNESEIRLPSNLQLAISSTYTKLINSENPNKALNLSLYSLNKFRAYMIKKGFPISNGHISEPMNKAILKSIISDLEFIGIIRNFQYNLIIQKLSFGRSLIDFESLRNTLEGFFEEKGIAYKK